MYYLNEHVVKENVIEEHSKCHLLPVRFDRKGRGRDREQQRTIVINNY